ncbi:MAG: hypothetical protein IKQ31_04930 [Clostridia bacterium]|nr:hypothetical protein [Clostridia bacterium]
MKTKLKSTVEVDDSAIIFDNVTFIGRCKVGANAIIYPFSIIIDSEIGANCTIFCSVVENSHISNCVSIGPFAHIRPDCSIESGCRIGNFVEIKNSVIGKNTKISHLAYVGDASVGENCNIGCGAIFVNYDGMKKNHTVVGDSCFIGSNCNIIAPIRLADYTYICAGTTVTSDSQENDFIIGRVRPITKANRAKKYWEGA